MPLNPKVSPMSLILDGDTPQADTNNQTTALERLASLPKILAQLDVTSLAMRLALAVPYWKSGVLKWDGFLQLSPVAPLLFESEFKLHIFGQVYDYPFPQTMAFMAGLGEIILPVLLVLGLFTRYAALGLLAMTAIIQITVPTGWPLHLTWAALAIGIMAIGPKRLSLDRLIGIDR